MSGAIEKAESTVIAVISGLLIAGIVYFVWKLSKGKLLPQIAKDVVEQSQKMAATVYQATKPSDPATIQQQNKTWSQQESEINARNKAQGLKASDFDSVSVPDWPTWGDYLNHLSNLWPWNWGNPSVPGAPQQTAPSTSVASYGTLPGDNPDYVF